MTRYGPGSQPFRARTATASRTNAAWPKLRLGRASASCAIISEPSIRIASLSWQLDLEQARTYDASGFRDADARARFAPVGTRGTAPCRRCISLVVGAMAHDAPGPEDLLPEAQGGSPHSDDHLTKLIAKVPMQVHDRMAKLLIAPRSASIPHAVHGWEQLSHDAANRTRVSGMVNGCENDVPPPRLAAAGAGGRSGRHDGSSPGLDRRTQMMLGRGLASLYQSQGSDPPPACFDELLTALDNKDRNTSPGSVELALHSAK